MENSPDLWLDKWPKRKQDCNKYDNGHVLCVSGPVEMAGAIRLGANAALRTGAGLVSIACLPNVLIAHAPQINEIMLQIIGDAVKLRNVLWDKTINSVLIGPGLEPNSAGRRMIEAIFFAETAIVLDGGAFDVFKAAPKEWFINIKQHEKPVVLTPHAGEFEKLFGQLADDKQEASMLAAKISGAIIVHKGAETVIAAPDGQIAINTNASPYLATAGSGDVLAGIIAGLLARNMDGFEAACAAVYLHGQAGIDIGPGLIAGDIINALPDIIKKICEK